MKNALTALALAGLFAAVSPAQRPWQQITVPSVRDVAANFKTPPREYGAIQPFMGWNGPDAKERMAAIVQDLDRLSANGVFVVNMSPGRGEPKYLSPEHMDQVKFVVQEAAKRGMKLWIQDEYDYPSGFAGGKISEQYPQLTMQALDADIRISVMPGQTLTMPTPPDTLGALAVFAQTGAVADCADRPERNQLDGPGATARRGRLPETVGADPGPAHLSQFSYPHVGPGRRHPRQRQPVFADRLPESGCHPRLPQDHPRNLQAGGGGRVRQDRSGLLRRRARLYRLHALDAQAARRVPATEGLRPPAIPAASVRARR